MDFLDFRGPLFASVGVTVLQCTYTSIAELSRNGSSCCVRTLCAASALLRCTYTSRSCSVCTHDAAAVYIHTPERVPFLWGLNSCLMASRWLQHRCTFTPALRASQMQQSGGLNRRLLTAACWCVCLSVCLPLSLCLSLFVCLSPCLCVGAAPQQNPTRALGAPCVRLSQQSTGPPSGAPSRGPPREAPSSGPLNGGP